MQETINYIHQSCTLSRFPNKLPKSLIFTQNFDKIAEQILLDDQGALNWYDYVNQSPIIYAGSECIHFVRG